MLLDAVVVAAGGVVVGGTGAVVVEKRYRGSGPGRIADPSTYFQSFSDLHSAINIARHAR